MAPSPAPGTDAAIAARQAAIALPTGWRRALDPQVLYRWHVRRLCPGRVLDLGCGVGRHLARLDPSSVGVDTNTVAVHLARARGLTAFTPAELAAGEQPRPGSFDVLLCSHVLEHLRPDDAAALLTQYLPLVRPGGRVVAICPQLRGQAADPTHVTAFPAVELVALLTGCGVVVDRVRSFPLPFAAGRWFTHNETVVVAHVPGRT